MEEGDAEERAVGGGIRTKGRKVNSGIFCPAFLGSGILWMGRESLSRLECLLLNQMPSSKVDQVELLLLALSGP